MQRKQGFTLIELLVVISIIAVLVSILMPALTKANELMNRSACGMNLNSIGRAIAMYRTEADGNSFPWIAANGDSQGWQASGTAGGDDDIYSLSTNLVNNLCLLVERGTIGYKAFLCPSEGRSAPGRGDANSDHGFYVHPGDDGGNSAEWFIDYGYHIGSNYWGSDDVPAGAEFAAGQRRGAILGDRCHGEASMSDEWNHDDAMVNLLTTDYSVARESGKKDTDSGNTFVNYGGDNPYTNGGGELGGGTIGGTPDDGEDAVLYHPDD
ncbi:MAG: type II secretion system protein [Phycisphaerae bacterium]|nr:type II secretion system protein [Phycisphaerae bacterium]